MRWVLKVILAAAVMTGVVGYIAHLNNTGRLSVPSWAENIVQRAARWEDRFAATINVTKLDSLLTDSTAVIYKWRDAAGVLHYTSMSPPAGVVAETVAVDSKANLIEAVPGSSAGTYSSPAE
ncbi:MAG TPA: DUF4124 domain-containing protein [Gammaproteobacteria bacterium]